ncbi:hypothetical protein AKJ40_00945 [candidate division MSBL1 archaeon SCGC-AAA259M10]|uniref:Uncharacterized protein n=2 Tax=candidate division MSBL1 TaxID=215777 RepID=A0A133UNU1_9EURY|nr:hypothetical protein AKJ38_04275 [candidate division MSBL1 archaeon SCGC-AAA259I14]KXB00697.1 hypothetical protein AKJ40_00945 [candidate division MSBL1 archaeon SCGC-AAA259M10]
MYWQLKKVLDFEEEIVADGEEGEENTVTYYIPDPKPVLAKFLNQVDGKWLLMSAKNWLESFTFNSNLLPIFPHTSRPYPCTRGAFYPASKSFQHVRNTLPGEKRRIGDTRGMKYTRACGGTGKAEG